MYTYMYTYMYMYNVDTHTVWRTYRVGAPSKIFKPPFPTLKVMDYLPFILSFILIHEYVHVGLLLYIIIIFF